MKGAHGFNYHHTGSRPDILQFFNCFVGIFLSYLFYGIILEFITQSKYGDDAEKFTFTYCLVLIQCIFSTCFSKAVSSVIKEGRDTTPMSVYALCSLTYVGAMLASLEALQHVSYPTQVLGKSIKPVPIMLMGVLIARKKYRLVKYIGVFIIVLGVVLFMQQKKPNLENEALDSFSDSNFGEFLLLFSLVMDAFTSAIQDKIKANYVTNTHSMMYNMNSLSCVWLLLAAILTDELIAFVGFLQKYPSSIIHLTLFGTCGSVGHHFIFKTISHFGTLTCAIFTTTRKFFTILASVLIFGNELSTIQWLGCVLVFTGLIIETSDSLRPAMQSGELRRQASINEDKFRNSQKDEIELI